MSLLDQPANLDGRVDQLERLVDELLHRPSGGDALTANYSSLSAAGIVTSPVFIDTLFFNVKDHGAKGDGLADDTAKINDTIALATNAGGGTVFFPAGVYRISGSGIQSTASDITLLGAGPTGSRLLYSGTGAALTWGPAYPAAIVSDANLSIQNLAVICTGAATEGIYLRRLQGFSALNVWSQFTASPTAGAAAWRFQGCNSGTLVNCIGRGHGSGNSHIAALFTDDPDAGANLITWIGGSLEAATTNLQAIFTTTACEACRLLGVNLAVPIQAPNVLLDGTLGWTIEGCYFEGTPVIGTPVTIQLGASVTANGTKIRDNFFTETAALNYNIWCQNTVDTLIDGNWINVAVAQAFVLADVGSTGTIVIGNQPDSVTYAVGMVRDLSGSQDALLIGRGGGSGCPSLSRAVQFVFSAGAEVFFQGQVKLIGGLDATTGAASPPAGAAGALPAAPAGYVTVFINGTGRRIPYY